MVSHSLAAKTHTYMHNTQQSPKIFLKIPQPTYMVSNQNKPNKTFFPQEKP